jgi:hypothetical protein
MIQALCDAIAIRHLLAYSTKAGCEHIVEPYAYGVTQAGDHALLCWRCGASASDPGGWELVRTDEMCGLRIVDDHFDSPRLGYARNDKRLSSIHSQL